MKTKHFAPPSWLSSLVFGAVVFVLFLGLGTALFSTWNLYGPIPLQNDCIYKQSESLILFGGVASGTIAAIFAVWAWRSPTAVRFHAAYIAGVMLLIITLTYVNHCMIFVWAGGMYYRYVSIASPMIVLYSSGVALSLIISAILCDRPMARAAQSCFPTNRFEK